MEVPESSGAIVTIKDIYDTVMETKFTVLGLDSKIEHINEKVASQGAVLNEHDDKIQDLYKKWYMVGGLAGAVGSLVATAAQLLLKLFNIG